MEFERLLKRDMGIASVVTVALSLCITSFSNADELANPQIIGGKISPAGSYPWLGALVDAEEEDLSRAQFCGCSLIDENWILTAAHCLYGEDSSKVAVAFGDGDLSKENRVIPIDLIILHP
ncbi:MAG: trypsin-like serine protease, partial [Verrucomicrobiota bacterium]